MRTIRTVVPLNQPAPCPECRGVYSHKLDCGTAATTAGIPPMTEQEKTATLVVPNGYYEVCCKRCERNVKARYKFGNEGELCKECWAFKRTRSGSPLPRLKTYDFSDVRIMLNGEELKNAMSIEYQENARTSVKSGRVSNYHAELSKGRG